jgi:hypothetical protein
MRFNRFVFLNRPMLSLETHLGVTTSPQAPFPADFVTLPVSGKSPPLRLTSPRSRRRACSKLHAFHPCSSAVSPSMRRGRTTSRRTPGDIPAPDLIRRRCAMDRARSGHVRSAHRPPHSAQPMPALQTVKGRFRCEVQALVGKPRNQLFWRQFRVPGTPQHAQHLRLLGRREGVEWAVMGPMTSILAFRVVAPTLDSAGRDADDLAGLRQSRAASLRLVDRAKDDFSLGSSVSSSSSL